MGKKSQPSVSAVICTFNGERYLAQQLESMLAQSTNLDEIVVSDDGSRDDTYSLITDFAQEHSGPGFPIWKIFKRDEPLGISANFEFALRQASGEIVFLADQDDIWDIDKVRLSIEKFSDQSVFLVHTDALLISSENRHLGSLMQTLGLSSFERKLLTAGDALRVLLRRNVVTGATVAIRASLLDLALPIPNGWIQDEWLAFVAASRNGMKFDSRMLTKYRQHDGNEIGVSRLDLHRVRDRLKDSRDSLMGRKRERNRGIQDFLSKNSELLGDREVGLLRQKIAFDHWRSDLSASRLSRVLPVIRRIRTGEYSDFARGYMDVLRDLLLGP